MQWRSGFGEYEAEQQDPWSPFLRAESLPGSTLLWLSVSGFPLRAAERQWVLRFLSVFSENLKLKVGLRVESFVNHDYIYPDLHSLFLAHAEEFFPVCGVLSRPSRPLYRPPGEEELREALRSGDESLFKAPKSLAYWLARKKGPHQAAVFFGYGAMVMLWLPDAGNRQVMQFPLELKALRNPMFAGVDLHGEIEFLNSLTDPFLPKSKEVFAPGLGSDPQYKAMPFAVPLLTAEDIFCARADQREAWLGLFPVYLAESRPDQGVLLWCRPEIDPVLKDCLQKLRGEELKFPLVAQA
jgi:hypothetical protein